MGCAFGKNLIHRAPDHHLHQLALGYIGHQARANQLAIAENGVAICDVKDFFKLVADEQNCFALGLKSVNQFIQLIDFFIA